MYWSRILCLVFGFKTILNIGKLLSARPRSFARLMSLPITLSDVDATEMSALGYQYAPESSKTNCSPVAGVPIAGGVYWASAGAAVKSAAATASPAPRYKRRQ